MASKQRPRPRKARNNQQLLIDLPFLDNPSMDMMNEDDESDVDESALESELEAILSGEAPSRRARPKKKAPMSVDIESMAAACLKDPTDDEEDDDALMDPELLRELQGLTSDSPTADKSPPLEEMDASEKQTEPKADLVSVLEERLHLYQDALVVVKELGIHSKIRRYTRAIKTLENLLKAAKSGRNVSEEDIPPVVSVPKRNATLPQNNSGSSPSDKPNVTSELLIPSPPSQDKVIPQEESISEDLKKLMRRQDEYKVAALQAKRSGDKNTALEYMKVCKGIESVIDSLKNGEKVDLSNMPPSPTSPAPVRSDETIRKVEHTHPSAVETAALAAASEPEDPAIFSAPPAPTSVLEALEQRLEKYRSTKDAAEAEANTSKVRRLQRIIKSYESAIKDYKAGKNVNFEELPTPPGFAPIPDPNQMNKPDISASKSVINENPSPEVKPPSASNSQTPPQIPSKASASQKPKIHRTNTSTSEKQLEFLLERQKLFRESALTAKRNGDIQQAKEYLKMMKGFDSMIEAVKCGLPIDTSSIPTPPQLQTDFVIVDVAECMEPEEGSIAELLETLEKDLTQQIEICTRNKEHFLRLGDVSSASKFEKLGLESRKDLCVIRHLKKNGESPPKFHYETRLFSMVQCHTDLSDNQLEVTVERGIDLPGKADDLDSYVRLELPIPSADSPQKGKTNTVKDTNNPIFQEMFTFEIHRKSRAQMRIFKRQALKLEVWSKGGFLRSDSLLGTVHVKLVNLESKCTIHDCFGLMDGRKACGGKLQVKIRIRDPLLVKQVEQVQEKWLVIGS